MECIAGVLLASIQAFELGTAEEWFMDVAQAQLRRQVSAPNSWVVVAPTMGHGVVRVAKSSGARAGIAALHSLLTRRFVLEAPDIQERWQAKCPHRLIPSSHSNRSRAVVTIDPEQLFRGIPSRLWSAGRRVTASVG